MPHKFAQEKWTVMCRFFCIWPDVICHRDLVSCEVSWHFTRGAEPSDSGNSGYLVTVMNY